jgi:hypothetical protein
MAEPFARIKESALMRGRTAKKEVAFRRCVLVGVLGTVESVAAENSEEPMRRMGSSLW